VVVVVVTSEEVVNRSSVALGKGGKLIHHSLLQLLDRSDFSPYGDFGWGPGFDASYIAGYIMPIPGADELYVSDNVDGAEDGGRLAMIVGQELP
jgi:hypothetical protein